MTVSSTEDSGEEFAVCGIDVYTTWHQTMWTLISTSSDAAESEAFSFRLLPDNVKTLGRAPRADFVVDAALVSRLHCRLTLSGADRLEVEDLGSTNGTWVNGEHVSRAPLTPGDVLKVGRIEFVVGKC